jgi:hypothetical protein
MNPKLKADEDYYFNEKGLMVFTEKHLLKRGYCCDSGCRHCPYKKKPVGKKLWEDKGTPKD